MKAVSLRTFTAGVLSAACILAPTTLRAQTTNTTAGEDASRSHEQATRASHGEASEQQLKVSDDEIRKDVSDINKASKLIGTDVKNRQEETLGRISDLAIDLESGRVAYAVLTAGGVLGIGGKQIAVPLESLTAKPGEEYLVIDATKERIEQAPGFADNRWPSLDQVQEHTVGLAAADQSSSRVRMSGSASRHDAELQPTGGASTRHEDQGGTSEASSRTTGAQAGSAIIDIRQLASADGASLEGKRVDLSEARVQRVYSDRLFTVTGTQGEEILVHSDEPLRNVQAAQTVRIQGTVGRTPSNLNQMGLDASAAQALQGKAICIKADDVKRSE